MQLFKVLLGTLALSAAFAPLALSHRPTSGLVSVAGITVLALALVSKSSRDIGRNFVDPFLPFVALALALGLMTARADVVRIFASIALVFVVARATRKLISVDILLPGIAIFAIGVSTLYFLRLASPDLFLLDLFTNLDSIGKNQVGWVTAFGIVASGGFVHFSWNSGPPRRILSLSIFGMLLLIGFSLDSMTGLIAALSGLLLASFVLSLNESRRNPFAGIIKNAPVAITFGAGVVGLSAIATANILAEIVNDFGQRTGRFLQRDFSTVTGRDKIWSCFDEASQIPQAEVWLYTQECTIQKGAPAPGHLHSNFLELLYYGGWFTLAVFVFGLLLTIILSSYRLLISEKSVESKSSEFFALSSAAAGSLISISESFLIGPYYFAAFVLFLASSAPQQKYPQSQTMLQD